MERFAKLAAQALNQVLETPIQPSDLETPPDPTLGDFGFPTFKLSKQFRKSPPQVAQQLVAELQAKGAVPKELTVAAVGPYVNFIVPPQNAMKALLSDILAGAGNGSYGKLPTDSRGTWVLEYSSPNVAKPLNIYHVRTTVLGAALDRVGRYRGYKVISINHLGDWGKQYGMLAVAFRFFGKSAKENLTMRELVDLYVKINAEADKNPALQDEARDNFRRLEQGDPAMVELWKKCVEISMIEFNQIYKRLGVKFDHVWGESFYTPYIGPLLESMKKKGVLVESEGAWIVPLTDSAGKEMPPAIMQKSDGSTIYGSRDVAAAVYRYEKLHFDRMTYIVGGEQKLHFQQVFGVLRKMEMSWADKCEHVPTGLYRFKDAKMSTRKGIFITLEDVLNLARERVQLLMEERAKADPNVPKADPAITEAVSIGAVIFSDLSTDPVRDVDFDVERVVDFEGETGPYLQYAHTRCQSILRKARETGQLKGDLQFNEALLSQLQAPEELALVKTLGQFPLHLERTLKFAKASQLASYMIDVTKAFGAFYRECHVLGEAPELTAARLMLVEATRRILAQGLGFIGIPLPERM